MGVISERVIPVKQEDFAEDIPLDLPNMGSGYQVTIIPLNAAGEAMEDPSTVSGTYTVKSKAWGSPYLKDVESEGGGPLEIAIADADTYPLSGVQVAELLFSPGTAISGCDSLHISVSILE